MPHQTPLISTIVIGLVLAFIFAALLQRVRVSSLVGYLLAGVVMGPFTPGFVGDVGLANELAEIGVILLMFGVGLHFSLEDLLSVRAIAIPGALIQIVLVTPLGMGLGWALGWTMAAGLVFGLALSVASTVVVLRALQEGRLLETERGRIAVGWLIVEDLVMVLTLVLIPTLALMLKGQSAPGGFSSLLMPVGLTLAKVAVFIVGMLLIGTRLIPWILHYVAHTGSRELFRIAVLAIALGFAYGAAQLFSVSFALGAFLAGMVMSELQLSQRAAQESLPLRDAFAVLFFVSVGMLFDPSIVVNQPLSLIVTVLIIVGAKAAIGYVLMLIFRQGQTTALVVAASRAQIGEFSFILAGLGVGLAILPETGRDLVLAGAIISILLNPLMFAAIDRWPPRQKTPEPQVTVETKPAPEARPAHEPIPMTTLTDHVVLVGHGRVGSFIINALKDLPLPLLVIEHDVPKVRRLREQGLEALAGNAADPEVVRAANFQAARCLLVAIPDGFEGGQVVEQARLINANLPIIARAHSVDEAEHLKRHGASVVVMGEHEIAKSMIADIPAKAFPGEVGTGSPSGNAESK